MARPAWYEYQEKVKDFLNEQPQVTAETNVKVPGVRIFHDIDVVANFTALGAPITWFIECKLWKTKVPIEKVLTLRTIVDEAGADRGLLIAENGFQSGAVQAAENTNVELITFDDFKRRVLADAAISRLTEYIARLAVISHRYWQHSKTVRKDYDLRLDPYSMYGGMVYAHYPIRHVLAAASHVIDRTQLRIFPVSPGKELYLSYPQALVGEATINSVPEAVRWLEANVQEMEKRMDAAEHKMALHNDFQPKPGGHMNMRGGPFSDKAAALRATQPSAEEVPPEVG